MSILAHLAVLAGLGYFLRNDFVGGLLPLSGGGGPGIDFLPPGAPGGGSSAARQLDLRPGERMALNQSEGEVEKESEDLEMAANVAVINAPLSEQLPDTYSQSLLNKFTAVSIDGPASPSLTKSHDLRRASSDVPPDVASYQPDLILIDIGMPRLNGHDTARRVREMPWGKDVMLIALTGWGQEEDRRKSHEAGFDLHLTKPIEPAALEKLLATWRAKTG